MVILSMQAFRSFVRTIVLFTTGLECLLDKLSWLCNHWIHPWRYDLGEDIASG